MSQRTSEGKLLSIVSCCVPGVVQNTENIIYAYIYIGFYIDELNPIQYSATQAL